MPEKQKKLFSDKRWNQPLGGRVIGHREITEDEKREVEEYIKTIEEKGK